jgi:signal transduction histidine kinase
MAAVGAYSVLWLLNGSSDWIPFSVGLLCSGLAPAAFAYLMLAHPGGRLRAPAERRLLTFAGGGVALASALAILTSAQPVQKTPLVGCVPNCPRNAFYLDVTIGGMAPALRVLIAVGSLALAWGTLGLLLRRYRSASGPLRHSLMPVQWAAVAYAVSLTAYFLARVAGTHSVAQSLGAVHLATVFLIPVAIVVGLGLERMFMGDALAEFVKRLAGTPKSDPQQVMAAALDDPTLRIAYAQRPRGTYVDSHGVPMGLPDNEPHTNVTWIGAEAEPVAAIIYDADLADQERFVQAAGAAAVLQLKEAQVEADLRASKADLAASRLRILETADAERRRIERDLHDGAQQDLIGLRIKLELAAEAINEDPARAHQIIRSVGRQMDDVLDKLRLLARGIYPSLLVQRGLVQALRSAARRSPVPIVVVERGLGRYRQELEVAVYFSCLEAIQNIVKHAGPDPQAWVRLWQRGPRMYFEVRDRGCGFDPDEVDNGAGLANMRDRIDAVGGTLSITSRPGDGTTVRGELPVD